MVERPADALYAPRIEPQLRLAAERIRREALLVSVAAVYVVVLCARLATQVGQDSWLMLVAGRDISAHGIPSHDHLTYWTAGSQWIDQQWAAQLLFYGLAVVGGIKLALFAHAALITATFALALALARMQGASVRATAWVAVAAVVPVVSGSWQLRAQTLALFLFVLLMWLLVRDEGRASRRGYLALPLLVVWANVHGSVVVGAALVVLFAALNRASRVRSVALAAGAVAAAFVTPYGPGMVDYYRDTLLNPAFSRFVTEWQPTTLRAVTTPVFLLLIGGIWLLASRGSRISVFQKAAFLLTCVLALLAGRNLAFMGLTGLIVLPRALDEVLPKTVSNRRRLDAGVVAAAVGIAVLSAPIAWRSVSSGIEDRYPVQAAAAVAAAASQNPGARVMSDVRFADWLLWEHPELAGRVAYDARFELLTYTQLERMYYWTNQMTQTWKAAADGARVVVLDLDATKLNERPLMAEPRARRLYRGSGIAVLERPAQAGS